MGTRSRVDTSPVAQGCPRGLKLRVQYENHTRGDLAQGEVFAQFADPRFRAGASVVEVPDTGWR